MERTTQASEPEALSAVLSAQLGRLIQEVSAWVQAEPRCLEEIEAQTVGALRALGTALLEGVVGLATATPSPAPTLSCRCGQTARLVRSRPATVRTVLGTITVARPYYHCTAWHHGTVPVDAALGLVAGSTSAGLDELLALLGAQEDSFAQGAAVLEKLTLVHVCPNLVRAATERLGQDLGAAEAGTVAAAWHGAPVPSPGSAPTRRYVSLDGVLVPTDGGWRECKLGTVYATVSRPAPRHPDEMVLRAPEASFVALVDGPEPFGQRLWCEAARRGVLDAVEVVALGDGAHWIWNVVAEHFPTARQIVDWYHAVAYLEPAGAAIYGEGSDLARQWVRQQRNALWAGDVPAVLTALQHHRRAGPAVQAAQTYYTHNQDRMDYPAYRAAGLQVGSGPIESGCRHVIGMRLKGAGMHWGLAGVQAVATVRAWLKSGRWDEAMALRSRRCRTYHCQHQTA